METLTTHGIRITVDTLYQPAHSEPARKRFLHVYNVRIENKNNFPVQLLQRKWYIVESTGDTKIVEGEGVIGQQPLIEPNQFHEYSSYCILNSDIGKMSGSYIMTRMDTGEQLEVRIPMFTLVCPDRLN